MLSTMLQNTRIPFCTWILCLIVLEQNAMCFSGGGGGGLIKVDTTTSNSSQSSNNFDKCPLGTELDLKQNRCIQVCNSDSSDKGVGGTNDRNNTDCLNRLKDKYNVQTTTTTSTDVLNIKLPSCKNVTLFQNEFQIGQDGNLTVTIDKVGQTLRDYQLSDNGRMANICYPLSPQLLQCQLRKLDASSYNMLGGRTLVNKHTNETIGIRDYYTSQVSEDVVACTEVIDSNRRKRCNYIRYKAHEYKFVDEHTLWLLPTNTSIYRPTYTTVDEDGSIKLCYPFSPEFTRCDLWVLEKHEYSIAKNHQLIDEAHHIVFDMRNYMISGDGRAVVCSIPAGNMTPPFDVYYVHAVFYVISAICLFVAFVVHLVVPSLNYHAKPLLCHMICLLTMYVSLAIRKFLPSIKHPWCYILFVITYYSSMASFFWLNVLAFDLWNIFSNLQTTSRRSCTCKITRHQLIYYNVYAWGMPIVFCAAVFILDTNPELQEILHLYPRIPAMCWFNEMNTAYSFFYIPMLIVLILNLGLFVSTVFNLRQASRGVEIVNKKFNKQLLFICFKLFIIMGFCWIGEATAWAVGTHVSISYVPDAISALQGVIIFAIYICKPATYRLLCDKFFPRTNSEGKWTMDFNISRATERKTSMSGMGMSYRDSSIKSSASSCVRKGLVSKKESA